MPKSSASRETKTFGTKRATGGALVSKWLDFRGPFSCLRRSSIFFELGVFFSFDQYLDPPQPCPGDTKRRRRPQALPKEISVGRAPFPGINCNNFFLTLNGMLWGDNKALRRIRVQVLGINSDESAKKVRVKKLVLINSNLAVERSLSFKRGKSHNGGKWRKIKAKPKIDSAAKAHSSLCISAL